MDRPQQGRASASFSHADSECAGSALLIMTLGAKAGDLVVVESDDDELVHLIAGLVGDDLDSQPA